MQFCDDLDCSNQFVVLSSQVSSLPSNFFGRKKFICTLQYHSVCNTTIMDWLQDECLFSVQNERLHSKLVTTGYIFMSSKVAK